MRVGDFFLDKEEMNICKVFGFDHVTNEYIDTNGYYHHFKRCQKIGSIGRFLLKKYLSKLDI